MPKLTQEMRDLISSQQCFVATVNADGTPNLGPKGSTRVLDDEHLAFYESTGRHTWDNLGTGGQIAIAVVDREKKIGFRFMGSPEIVTSGELYEKTVAARKKAGMRPLKAVVTIRIDEIYDLSPAHAGEEIA